jgi:hypothetical protein
MAKRFTETDKWKDAWFRKLCPNEKLLFIYLTENCNNAGFIEFDVEAVAFQTRLSEDEVLGAIQGLNRGCFESDGWVWIKRFLRHQKNESLNPANNAHKQIIALLNDQVQRFSGNKDFDAFVESEGIIDYIKKSAPNEGLNSPTGKGQVKVKVKVKEEEEVKEEVVVSSTETNADEIYREYPRKVGRVDAIKAIRKALRKVDAETLRVKTIAFCRSWSGKDLQYCPHPATWFNQERWLDEEGRAVTPNANGNEEERAAYYAMVASEGIIA